MFCQGKGVERYTLSGDHPHRLEIGLNAFRVLAALGLPSEPYGSCTIPEARRGLLRAHNTQLAHLVRQAEAGYGAPCVSADGTVELRLIRQIMAGLSLDGLLDRIARFEAFVNAAAAAVPRRSAGAERATNQTQTLNRLNTWKMRCGPRSWKRSPTFLRGAAARRGPAD